MKTLKDLKVYGVPWHIAHQYELAKLFGEYHMQLNPYRFWADQSRPMPENMKYVLHFQKGYYDLAILHVDQQSIYDPDHGDRITKGRLFMELKKIIGDDVPIIVINHMTPFHDKYETPYVIDFIKKLTAGTREMIVNSHEARQQWGWGRVITHGMEVGEWSPKPKEPRVVVAISQNGMEKAYRRIFLHAVKRQLEEIGVPLIWIGADKRFGNFEDYRDFLARSLVYFNPTWQSPMPRARTEAMLSGCCVVTTPYHDADTFIQNGVNGFLTSEKKIVDPRVMDNPKRTADLLFDLVVNRPEECLAVGERGRQTALELFNSQKFEQQWDAFAREVGIL